MKKICNVLFSTLMSVFLLSCETGFYKVLDHGDDVTERTGTSLTDIPAPTVTSAGNLITFVMTSDVHFGSKNHSRNESGFYAKLTSLVNSTNPAPSFLICLGDVVENGKKGEYEDYVEWTKNISEILTGSRNTQSVFTVPGNHDLYNDGWNHFKSLVYPNTSLYTFTIQGISFYFCDSGSGSMGKSQFNIIKKRMENDRNKKIVLTHYPIYGSATFFRNYYSMQNTQETDNFMTLFTDENVKQYFSGHMHPDNGITNNLGSFTEYVLPSYLSQKKFFLVTLNTSDCSITKTEISY